MELKVPNSQVIMEAQNGSLFEATDSASAQERLLGIHSAPGTLDRLEGLLEEEEGRRSKTSFPSRTEKGLFLESGFLRKFAGW